MANNRHIVSLSGGSASAVAADRVINRYGKDSVTLWFADTLWEDEDLYRFLIDLEARWGMTIERFADGRTPLEVAEDKKLIPNSLARPVAMSLNRSPSCATSRASPSPSRYIWGCHGMRNIGWASRKKSMRASRA